MPGERNADQLEKRDIATSEKVFDDMPPAMQRAIENKIFREKDDDHLRFLKIQQDYYAVIDISGTLCKIDENDFSMTELFSMKKYMCNLKVKDGKLYFFTGNRDRRQSRKLRARLIHPYQITVLTNVQKWIYDFETNEVEKQ